MKITFYSAAGTVSGSKHLVTLKTGKKYLLNCKMFQGLVAQTGKLNNHWGLTVELRFYITPAFMPGFRRMLMGFAQALPII